MQKRHLPIDVQDVAHQPHTKTSKLEITHHQTFKLQNTQQKIETTIKSTVVLATANVRVQNGTQVSENCRALLDTGAHMNLVTCECMRILKLPAIKCYHIADGIAGSQIITQKVRTFIRPSFESNFTMKIEMFVMENFCGNIPSFELPTVVPEGIELADPSFRIPAEVQMLLGAEVWAAIIGNIMYRHIDGTILQETLLGYICYGRVLLSRAKNELSCVNLSLQKNEEQKLIELIEKFWNIEEPRDEKDIPKTEEEKQIEKFFKQTCRRNEYGRYIVQIPLKQNALPIADSRNIVMRRFHQLENKLQKDPTLKTKYIDFIFSS